MRRGALPHPGTDSCPGSCYSLLTRLGQRGPRLGALIAAGLFGLAPTGVWAQPAATSAPVVPIAPAAAATAAAPAPAPAAKPAAAKPVPAKPATATAPRPAGGAAAKPAVAAAAKPVPVPKLTPAPKSPPLSKAELFQRAAPATVFLIAQEGNRFQTALGTIVKPQGVVVSDSRLISGVEKGSISAFLTESITPGDEDPVLFMRANQDKALPVQLVRADPTSHLLLLQLPLPQPKKTYRSLDLFDVRSLSTVGVDVLTLRTRGRQTLGFGAGTIAASRPDLIEVEPSLLMENAGGPVLSMTGRLLGVSIFLDKATSAPGVVRPVDAIFALLTAKPPEAPPLKEGEAPPSTPPEMNASESRNAVEAVRIAMGTTLAQRMDKRSALQLHSEFIGAMAMRGRTVVTGVDSGEVLNGLVGGLTKDSPFKAKVVDEIFPMLVVDKKGQIWVKKGTKYELQKQSGGGVAAIDDVTGGLYATDSKKQLMFFEAATKTWRNTGLSPVSQARATDGMLFVLLEDGRLLIAQPDGKDSMQIFPRSLAPGSSIQSTAGNLYVIEKEQVFRYRKNDKGKLEWENKLKPIAFAMKRLVARGDQFYSMDSSGRVFSSAAQRYIDREGNIAEIWPIGKDLLALTKDNLRFFYSLAADKWSPWTQW